MRGSAGPEGSRGPASRVGLPMGSGGRARKIALAATLGLVMAAVVVAGCAGRSLPGVVLPKTRRASAPADRPRGGQDRGDVEIALGAVVTGVAATLVVLGAFSFYRGQELQRYCAQAPLTDFSQRCTDPLGFDPVRGARISGGLAFALAVPIAAGGGLLLRKGIRMRREWQRERRGPSGLSLRPWLMRQPSSSSSSSGSSGSSGQPGVQGAGLDLSFRF